MSQPTFFLVKKPMRNQYVGKIDTIALLLLGGVDPKKLQGWYPGISDADVAKAQKKIEKLGLQEVNENG